MSIKTIDKKNLFSKSLSMDLWRRYESKQYGYAMRKKRTHNPANLTRQEHEARQRDHKAISGPPKSEYTATR